MYIPLGVKTDYTLLSSLIKIPELINFALKHDIKALGILDDNLSGSLEFYNLCLKKHMPAKLVIWPKGKHDELSWHYYLKLFIKEIEKEL